MSLGGETKGARPRRRRKYRDKFAIIADILTIAQRGERKTHVMYRANLSFIELEVYLGFLMQQGLIEQRPDREAGGVSFRTTHAGFDFMRRYEDLRELISPRATSEEEGKEVALGSR